MSKKKEYVFCCEKCKVNTRHAYVGRERQALLGEIILSILTIGFYPLKKIIMGEAVGGTTFWECTKCGCIKREN